MKDGQIVESVENINSLDDLHADYSRVLVDSLLNIEQIIGGIERMSCKIRCNATLRVPYAFQDIQSYPQKGIDRKAVSDDVQEDLKIHGTS